MSEHIRITRTDGVLRLVMARPDKKNALTHAMYLRLAEALEAANADAAVRVVLIAGEGDMFTAGNDLADFAAASPNAGTTSDEGGMGNVGRFLSALVNATKPIVAAVQGKAVGVGATMLLHCDYVVLAADAQLIVPFVNLALVPEAASSLLLTARIGHVRAFAAFGLGEPIGARDAVAWGLANRVVGNAELAAAVDDVAARLARQPAGALAATKALMKDGAAIRERMDTEAAEFTRRLSSPEAKEAFAAFAERRAPDFTRFDSSDTMNG